MKKEKDNFDYFCEHLRNCWLGLKQHKFRITKERPDSERYVKRRTKQQRTVKRRYSYKIEKSSPF